MVRLQQQLGAKGGVVMEGRDIGTVVFPHAEVKIFLDAAPEVTGRLNFTENYFDAPRIVLLHFHSIWGTLMPRAIQTFDIIIEIE